MCAKKFRWCWWRAEQRVKHAQTREWGPPSAPVEIHYFIALNQLVLIGGISNLFSWHIWWSKDNGQCSKHFRLNIYLYCWCWVSCMLALTNKHVKHICDALWVILLVITLVRISKLSKPCLRSMETLNLAHSEMSYPELINRLVTMMDKFTERIEMIEN